MIINCECGKKFAVKDDLIPNEGKMLQCGSCGNKWFFKPNLNEKLSDQIIDQDSNKNIDEIPIEEVNFPPEKIYNEEIKISEKTIIEKNVNKETLSKKVKNEKPDKKKIKKNSNLMGNFFVTIISIIALIIILDTFKIELSQIFPGTIQLLDNLYQTLYDIYLFFKDLIN
tara:strand:+ start:121 stop:630 length:510 start_codon:yes stop_codon:yes gene_type:complete